jgi:hypothetical protein
MLIDGIMGLAEADEIMSEVLIPLKTPSYQQNVQEESQ